MRVLWSYCCGGGDWVAVVIWMIIETGGVGSYLCFDIMLYFILHQLYLLTP